MLRPALLALVPVALAACLHAGFASSRAALMTPHEIDTHGTREFDAPLSKVFDASIGALKAQGYSIAAANPDSGVIVTGRKLVRQIATGSQSYAEAIDLSRQYRLELRPAAGGHTLLIAHPRVFEGERDISEQQVWDLDGPAGERVLWRSLFQEIGDLL